MSIVTSQGYVDMAQVLAYMKNQGDALDKNKHMIERQDVLVKAQEKVIGDLNGTIVDLRKQVSDQDVMIKKLMSDMSNKVKETEAKAKTEASKTIASNESAMEVEVKKLQAKVLEYDRRNTIMTDIAVGCGVVGVVCAAYVVGPLIIAVLA